ncbi:class I SAM-dependent methyltransferase [Anoxynatronum sibiricum]|uniref:Methyltransferase domain-containing protein n=1 Tax=Anoxynatronum sibiricum TaxID=210623 RepID=A0ABU9VT67_9CLOT
MATIEEKLAKSLTAETTELIPYLPYLLQDLWDLGSSPRDIVHLMSKHMKVTRDIKVLDLACGKGAVSVYIAREMGCSVKGIDLMPDFIADASQKSRQHGVESLCEFAVGDITEAVLTEKGYDVVILGAVGDVLGSPEETIIKLKNTIKPKGYLIIDDAYGQKGASIDYLTRAEWLDIFEKTGVGLLEDLIVDEDELKGINDEQQGHIAKRAAELKHQYPESAWLFDSYLQSQQAEVNQLENEISGVTMILKDM